MKITPAPTKVVIESERPTVGALDTSSKVAAIEVGTVKEVGSEVEEWKKGDKLLFKSYGIATIEYGGKTLTFIDVTSKSIQGRIDE